MKRLILACSLVGIMAMANAAEPPAHPAFDSQQHASHLQKSLQLTDEQTAKVKKIFDGSERQRKALRDKYKPQLDAFRADQKALHEQTHSQIEGLLTPKQLEAFKAQADKHGRRSMRGPMHGGGMDDDGPHGEHSTE
jgi:Spy/CpxP family protein refolding chaperone